MADQIDQISSTIFDSDDDENDPYVSVRVHYFNNEVQYSLITSTTYPCEFLSGVKKHN